MKYLSDTDAVVAALFEDLWECDRIGSVVSEVGMEVPDLDGVGTKSCQQTGPRRVADR